jgi:putative transposase
MCGRKQVLALPQDQQPILLKEQLMVILPRLKRLVGPGVMGLRARILQWTAPLTSSLPLEALADLGRSKSELVAENALLRQQLIILKRQVKRPACTKTDRLLLVLLARVVRTWKQALFIVQPETRLAVASGALPLGLEA